MTDRVSCLLNILNYWCTTPQSICFLHMKWLEIRLPELSTTPTRKTSSLVLSLVDNLFIKLARWWASQPRVQTTSGRSTWPQVLPETCLALDILGVLQTRLNTSLSEPLWKSADCCFRRLPTQLTWKSVMWLFEMFWLVQDTTCTLPSPTDSTWTPHGLHKSTWTPSGLHLEKTSSYNFA